MRTSANSTVMPRTVVMHSKPTGAGNLPRVLYGTDAPETFNAPARRAPASWLRRLTVVGEDVLLLGGIILGIPLAILAIGIPIALVVQLLLWLVRLT